MSISSHDSSVQTFDLQALVRPNIRSIKPYSSARSEFTGTAEIFLDANENAFGSPPHEVRIERQQALHRYPDPLQKAVKSRLAALKHVTVEQLFLGNGSDEVIDLLIRGFCEPGQDEILITPPTYGMYEVSADIQNARVLRVPLLLCDGQYILDTDAVLRAVTPRTKLVFLCSPGNPTGALLDAASVHRIVQGFHGIVVLDEAYIDFVPQATFVPLVQSYPNLVVMQTLSKAWGLAALRLGILVASPDIVRVLNSIKPPYNINALTQEYVLHALRHPQWKEKIVRSTVLERERLRKALSESSMHELIENVYPSDANFLLVKIRAPHNPRAVYAALMRAGIIVRDRSTVPLCERCLRITVGTEQENTRLLEVLQVEVLQAQQGIVLS